MFLLFFVLVSTGFASSTLYNFGGIYSIGNHGSCAYSNPLTGNCTCSPGYSSQVALGTYGVDYVLHYCYTSSYSENVNLGYDFGGMYGYYSLNGGFKGGNVFIF